MPAKRIRKRMRRMFAAGRRRAKSAARVVRPPITWTFAHGPSGAVYRTSQHDSGIPKRKGAANG